MDQQQQRLTELLDKYIRNGCTNSEMEELFNGILSGKHDELLNDHVMTQMQAPEREGANLETHRSAVIIQNILSQKKEKTAIVRMVPRKNSFTAYAAAAAVILAIITGVLWWRNSTENSLLVKTRSNKELKADHKIANSTGKVMLVRLADGSRITLQPDAVLHYQDSFNGEKREVYLEGEAFFDIAHNARKPFIVYHEHLMTRVLGTKFYIRYNEKLKEAEVEVSAGRVEVSENVDDNEVHKRNNGVIITPNQKVVYAEEKRMFSTVIVDDPLPLITAQAPDSATALSYAFEAAPMSVIIEQLEKDYGIEIQMENEDIKNCLFSGDITNNRLYAKLDILCKTIGIFYELKGTRILLKGKGCR